MDGSFSFEVVVNFMMMSSGLSEPLSLQQQTILLVMNVVVIMDYLVYVIVYYTVCLIVCVANDQQTHNYILYTVII